LQDHWCLHCSRSHYVLIVHVLVNRSALAPVQEELGTKIPDLDIGSNRASRPLLRTEDNPPIRGHHRDTAPHRLK
jgi:hypothetical protein